jgi:adenosylhomocysteine nucleosidase
VVSGERVLLGIFSENGETAERRAQAMSTWLLISAEARELSGLLKRAANVEALDWAGIEFAREVELPQGRWLLAANGPGRGRAAAILETRRRVDGLMSVGFCGALDPELRIGDIVVSGEIPVTGNVGYVRGNVLCLDRVVVKASEKRTLRQTTGADAVEMESAAVAAGAEDWGVPFCSVRVVSDTAQEDMPLDFNDFRDSQGRFSRIRIAAAALRHPGVIAGLLRLERNCGTAAESLGEFLANCKF